MTCVNMDNNAVANAHTGEEAQASDIFKTVVGSWIGGESDQVVGVPRSANGLVGRLRPERVPQKEGSPGGLTPRVEQDQEPLIHAAFAGVVVL
jgi:hypothetical protein